MQQTKPVCHKHQNGEDVAMSAVLPLVQFLVRNGEGWRFCWEDLRRLPSTADGVMYLLKIAGKLPTDLSTEANKIVEDNIPASLLTRAA